MNIEELLADLKQQGLDDNAILEALTQMVQEGKITPEDLEKAKQMLGGEAPATPDEEKEKAGQLFGLNLM